jgi:hypothetical protein
MKVTSRGWSWDLVSTSSSVLMLMILARGGLRAQTPPCADARRLDLHQEHCTHSPAFVPGVSPAKRHSPNVPLHQEWIHGAIPGRPGAASADSPMLLNCA